MKNKIPWNKLDLYSRLKIATLIAIGVLLSLGVMFVCFYFGGTLTIESPALVKTSVAFLAAGLSLVFPGIILVSVADTWPDERGY
jgi:hypothetical protein